MAWTKAISVDSLTDGEVTGITLKGHEIAVFRLGGRFFATSNVCTHEFAFLSDGDVEGDCIECPLHQARFHIPTGEARSAPASLALARYEVRIDADSVLIDVGDA